MDPKCDETQGIFDMYPVDIDALETGIGMTFVINGDKFRAGCEIRHIVGLDLLEGNPIHEVDVHFGDGRGLHFVREYGYEYLNGAEPECGWTGYSLQDYDVPGDAEDETLAAICADGHFAVIPALHEYALSKVAMNTGF